LKTKLLEELEDKTSSTENRKRLRREHMTAINPQGVVLTTAEIFPIRFPPAGSLLNPICDANQTCNAS